MWRLPAPCTTRRQRLCTMSHALSIALRPSMCRPAMAITEARAVMAVDMGTDTAITTITVDDFGQAGPA